jgi:hypothetical protein
MAMLTRSGSTTVTELSLDTDYSLGDDGVYDKVVLAFVSLESGTQTVSITAERSAANTLSVDNRGSGGTSSGMLKNSPNPFSGSTSISFSTAAPGPVTLQIFDATGAIVRTLIDGERVEAGEHTVAFSADGLPNGYYTARLTEAGGTLTRAMVVVK